MFWLAFRGRCNSYVNSTNSSFHNVNKNHSFMMFCFVILFYHLIMQRKVELEVRLVVCWQALYLIFSYRLPVGSMWSWFYFSRFSLINALFKALISFRLSFWLKLCDIYKFLKHDEVKYFPKS